MLPKLYKLEKVAVIGHLRNLEGHINCRECGRQISYYRHLELMLDSWPECDFVTVSGASYFASDRFLTKLGEIEAHGYIYQPVTMGISDDFHLLYPNVTGIPHNIPTYYYFVITGHCDGPWIRHTKAELCSTCGQPKAALMPAAKLQRTEHDPASRSLVYSDTWHGEDFFNLSEPGRPLITERVAAILAELGDLRTEKITNREEVLRFMPNYAAELEKKGWEIDKCVRLGVADWVERA